MFNVLRTAVRLSQKLELFRLDNSLQFLVLFLIRLPVCEFVTIGTMFFNEFAKILVFTTGRSYPLKNVILPQVVIKKVYYILVFILEKMYLCKRQVNNSYFTQTSSTNKNAGLPGHICQAGNFGVTLAIIRT